MSQYVRAKVIADKYGVAYSTVVQWAKKGLLPHIAMPGKGILLFDPEAVDAAMQTYTKQQSIPQQPADKDL